MQQFSVQRGIRFVEHVRKGWRVVIGGAAGGLVATWITGGVPNFAVWGLGAFLVFVLSFFDYLFGRLIHRAQRAASDRPQVDWPEGRAS